MERVLVGGVNAVHAVMGSELHVRSQGGRHVENLPELGAPFGLTAEGVALVRGGRQDRVSRRRSARRSRAGDLEWPRTALGRRFVLDGEVVSGHGRGKGLGFPTANLQHVAPAPAPGAGDLRGVAEHRGLPTPGGDRRGHQPDVRHGAAACGGVPVGLRRRRPAGRTARARVLGAPPRRGALRHRGRDLVAAIADDVERTREIVSAHVGVRTVERPPRAAGRPCRSGPGRRDRAGRGRDDGGVGACRRRRGGPGAPASIVALAERGGEDGRVAVAVAGPSVRAEGPDRDPRGGRRQPGSELHLHVRVAGLRLRVVGVWTGSSGETTSPW